MAEELSVIPCTVEELNHVLDKWIEDGIVRPRSEERRVGKEC